MIWKATDINTTPLLELAGYKIYEVSSKLWEGRTRHFSGYNLTEHEGRVSSNIVEFDKANKTGITKSGRIYKLKDNRITLSEYGDSQYVWDYFCNRNELFDIVDVTTILLNE